MFTLKIVSRFGDTEEVHSLLGSGARIHRPGSEYYSEYFEMPIGSCHKEYKAVVSSSENNINYMNWVIENDCSAYIVNANGKTVSSIQ